MRITDELISRTDPRNLRHLGWLVPTALAGILIGSSFYNYLLFHTLAELFAIVVAILMFVVALNTYAFSRNHFLMYLGCGYFWVAMLDLVHALTYKGLEIFPPSSHSELAIDFWLLARYSEALLLLSAPVFLGASLRQGLTFMLFGVAACGLFVVGMTEQMPSTFVEGQGLTDFKIYSEYTIIGLLAFAALFLYQRRSLLDPGIVRMMLASMILTMGAELAFTFYVSLYGLSNLVGHILKLFSFWLIFVSIVRTTLTEPFRVMSRGMSTYDAIPDATVMLDEHGQVRQANRAAERLTGLPREAMMGRHCHELFHPQALALTECPVCQAVSRGDSIGALEMDCGPEQTYEFSLTPLAEETKERGLVHVAKDVSERKRAEQELKETEYRDQLLFERLPIGLALCDMQGKLIYVNDGYAEMIGRQPDEVLRLSYWDITPESYKDQEEAALRSIKATGQYGPYEKEYIHKDGHRVPVRLRGLTVSLRGEPHIWSSVENISERRQWEAQLIRQANYDDLTGLPNRVLVQDRLRQALSRAQRDGNLVALMFLDTDDFKKVNDTGGHALGDKLLQELGKRLASCVRDMDTVARLGGDEFVIILTEIDSVSHIETVVQKLNEVISGKFVLEQQEFFVSMSIGIAVYPDDGTSGELLLRNADAAMYKAKSSGKATHRFFTQAMNDEVVERLQMETCLRGALVAEELSLVFQPQFAANSGEMVAAEALLRWHSKELGTVAPDMFVPLAEDAGLIEEIGAWVLDAACAAARHWYDAHGCWLRVAVNVSPRQIVRGALPEHVRTALEQSGMPPECLELEITETVLMDDGDKAYKVLSTIRDMGVRLSLDDFGTGFSSLSYLRRYPFDTLKIDRSFTADIPHQPEALTLCDAIISMAANLGMSVVAEGVETEQQMEKLREHGAEYLQGYFLERPVSAETIGSRLEAARNADVV